jgi:hypothetical protein
MFRVSVAIAVVEISDKQSILDTAMGQNVWKLTSSKDSRGDSLLFRAVHRITGSAAVILLLITFSSCTWSDQNIHVPDHILEIENVTVYSHADIESADTLRLVREQIFSDTEENPISSFSSIVNDSMGRVYIGDPRQYTIHLFKDDGSYLGRFGREGSGPGEFRWVGGMVIHENLLYAYDVNGRRIHLFELGSDARNMPVYETSIVLGGEHWDDFPEPGFMNPAFHTIKSDGTLLLSSHTSPFLYREHPDSLGVRRYYRWSGDPDQKPESIFEIPEPKHIVTEFFLIPPPFESRGLFAITGSDRIYWANTAEILIQSHNREGQDASAFYYPFEHRTLTRSEAIESVDDHEQLRDAVQSMQIPDTWPALQRMIADNSGRIWLSVYTERDQADEWWVLEESGELLARFHLSDWQSIARIDQHHLYIRETEPESGNQLVVRYRIELEM